MRRPTPAQLDALSAWWWSGGSNLKAAASLHRAPQTIKNQLQSLRREQGVDSNLELAKLFLTELQARFPIVQHNQHAAGAQGVLVSVEAYRYERTKEGA